MWVIIGASSLKIIHCTIYPFLQDISASLCFRGQRIFLHNASGWFGNVPLEASGDFGIHPDEGEFHLMCQVQCEIPPELRWCFSSVSETIIQFIKFENNIIFWME